MLKLLSPVDVAVIASEFEKYPPLFSYADTDWLASLLSGRHQLPYLPVRLLLGQLEEAADRQAEARYTAQLREAQLELDATGKPGAHCSCLEDEDPMSMAYGIPRICDRHNFLGRGTDKYGRTGVTF